MPTYNEIKQWTKNHRDAFPNDPIGFGFTSNDIAVIAAAYTAGTIDGVRCYNAIDGNGNKQLVAVAYKKDANDVPQDVNITTFKVAKPCPFFCGGNNDFNS